MVANSAIFVNENENEPKKISNSFTRLELKLLRRMRNEYKLKKDLQPNGIKTRTKIQSRTKMKF